MRTLIVLVLVLSLGVTASPAAAARVAKVKCPTEEFSKMTGPLVANDKTTELVTVKLQNNLYLSVVQSRFDIVILC